MKNFKSFISESVESPDFTDLFSLVKFANPSHKQSTERYLRSLHVLQDAIEAGSITKRQYEDCKYDFDHFFDSTSSYMFYNAKSPLFVKIAEYRETLGQNEWPESYRFRKSRKEAEWAEKMRKIVPEYADYAAQGGKLFSFFVDFKKNIAQKAPKAMPTVNIQGKTVYLKKMASAEAISKIHGILTDAFDQIRNSLIESLFDVNMRLHSDIVKFMNDNDIKNFADVRKAKMSKRLSGAYSLFFDFQANPKGKAEQIAHKDAIQSAKGLEEFFVGKNVQKLSVIFERKHELKTHKIISNKVDHNGVLINKMYFEFDDGSHFMIDTTVEYVYDAATPFIRMPTRFSDVYHADGTKMSQPSEEKMDKTF